MMPTVMPNGLAGLVVSETLSDGLFAPMSMLKRAYYPADLGLVPHNHGGTGQFLLVLSGETVFAECGLAEFHCTPGTAIIVPPHCEHWWRMIRDTTLLQFHHRPFSQAAFGHLALLFGLFQKRLVAIETGQAEAERLMERIEQILGERTAPRDALISAVLLEFMARVLDRSRVLDGELAHGMHPAIIRAIAYIEENIRQPITLRDLSVHAHLGSSRLCQLFREQVGHSPAQYIAEKKAQMAERLLLNPTMTVSEVADHLGFTSINYFSRFYRKQFGMSPSEARSRNPSVR